MYYNDICLNYEPKNFVFHFFLSKFLINCENFFLVNKIDRILFFIII